MPDWGTDPEDLQKILVSLSRHTPPTALIIDDPFLFMAVLLQLCRLGLKVPEQISLACLDYVPEFEWCRPQITHLSWSTTPVINRLVKWVHNISLGKVDHAITQVKAKLVTGDTIGPAPK